MRRFVDYEGVLFDAVDAAALVTMMRHAARWSGAETDAEYMAGFADRAKLSGARIRSDAAEHFVADVIAAGFIRELS